MKTKDLMIFLFAVLLAVAGCASLPGGDVYSLKETQLHLHWRLEAYYRAYRAGGVTESQAQRVASARKVYDLAYQKAVSDAGGNLEAPTSPALQNAANQLLFAINDVMSTLTP